MWKCYKIHLECNICSVSAKKIKSNLEVGARAWRSGKSSVCRVRMGIMSDKKVVLIEDLHSSKILVS